MNVVYLLLAGIVIAVLLSRLAKLMLYKMDSNKEIESSPEQKIEVKTEKTEKVFIPKENDDFKKVLSKNNCESSKKTKKKEDHKFENTEKESHPKKHKKNFNRDKSGRFKSNKEWKKEQKTY